MKQYLITSEDQILSRIQNALKVLEGRAMTAETIDLARSLLKVCLLNLLEEGVLVAMPDIGIEWDTSARAIHLTFPKHWEDCIAKGLP